MLIFSVVNFAVVQNISASFSASKNGGGGHDPPAPMGAPPVSLSTVGEEQRQWTVTQTLNYSHQIAFKLPYRPTVVELFYSALM